MGKITLSWLLVWALAVAAAGTAKAGPENMGGLELKIYALDSSQGKSLRRGEKPWLARLVRGFAPLAGPKVRIDRRTEFHAVLIDHNGRHRGKPVKLRWLHGPDRRLFARPQTLVIRQAPGYPKPMAVASAYSAPSKTGGLLGSFLGGSSMSRDKWERSRCYGPRAVVVTDTGGRPLARAYFEIYPAGKRVY